MADYDIVNQVLANESGRIGDDILTKTLHSDPILTLTKEGQWPEGMGESVKVLTWSRTLPIDSGTSKAKRVSWETVEFSADGAVTGAGGACVPPVNVLPFGYDVAEYDLQQTSLESPNLCVNDLRNSFKRQETLNAIRNGLADATKWVMIQRFRQLFTQTCTAAIVVTSTGFGSGSDGGDVIDDISGSGLTPGVLTNGLLQRCYSRLIGRGAGESTMLKEDGAPVFPLITSMEQSRALKVASNYRDDYRWNPDKVGELLAALGAVSKPVLGFQHIISVKPDRWEWSGGAWTWVPPYKQIASSVAGKYIIVENPDYETATWEDSYVFHPDVFHAIFPGSIGDAGGGATFNPVKYRGEWSWLNIKDRITNPDGTIGAFRGVFMLGGKPVFPNYGYVIRHARCDLSPLYAACS